MTVSKAINTRILIDGYLISSQTNKVSVKLDAQKTDITPFEAKAQEFLVLDPAPSIDLSGYIHHSPAAATYDAISHGALDVPVTVTVIRSATSTFTGAPATTLPNATAISLSQDYPVDGVMGIQATWGGATPMRRGIVPYAGLISATGAIASVDLGAQGTTGGYAYLHVTTITGTATDAAIKVQSSATEGGSYADEGTFTFSDIGIYPIDLTGTIDRWIRLNCTSKGGATSFVVHAIVVVKGVTQTA
jgi:hypothetical protein